MRRLSDVQEREIVERYVAGETGRELGAEFGISPSSVCVLAKLAGRSPGLKGRSGGGDSKLTPSQRTEIIARRAAGERGTDLAAEFSVSTASICLTVKREFERQISAIEGEQLTADGPFVQHWRPSHHSAPPPNAYDDIPVSRLMAGR